MSSQSYNELALGVYQSFHENLVQINSRTGNSCRDTFVISGSVSIKLALLGGRLGATGLLPGSSGSGCGGWSSSGSRSVTKSDDLAALPLGVYFLENAAESAGSVRGNLRSATELHSFSGRRNLRILGTTDVVLSDDLPVRFDLVKAAKSREEDVNLSLFLHCARVCDGCAYAKVSCQDRRGSFIAIHLRDRHMCRENDCAACHAAATRRRAVMSAIENINDRSEPEPSWSNHENYRATLLINENA